MVAELVAPPDPRALPRRFGRYALFDFIGKGGMAETYLARAKTELGGVRLCVVKQVIPEFASYREFAEMLIHEAKLAARLDHANIVQVSDLGREGDTLYIAMEYVEGYDLNELLRRCTKAKVPLPLEFALYIVCDALKGLDYAHRRTGQDKRPLGIVHRDVSPSNVLVSFDGEVKLCDFGIAHANDLVASVGNRLDDAIKGKAGYMSPEHARGEAIDARADVFAVGIVLWELLAGRRLYKADSAKAPLLEQAKAPDIPPLPERGLVDEPTLRRVVAKALAVDRGARYSSTAAMLRDLEAYVAGAKLVASPLKLGEWLRESFGTEIVEKRRARERVVAEGERVVPPSANPLPPAKVATSDGAIPVAPVAIPPLRAPRIEPPPSSVQAAILEVGAVSSAVVPRGQIVRQKRNWVMLVVWIALIIMLIVAWQFVTR